MGLNLPGTMTDRTKTLRENLYDRAMGNRSSEWFRQEMLPDVGKNPEHREKPVIIRRAIAIREMLDAMTNEENSKTTHSYEILKGELIVGVLPMGSNGLGKVFPNYLTEVEERVGSITNRTEMSLLGHNSINYERLLGGGIKAIVAKCDDKLECLETNPENIEKINFYEAVKTSCEAVVDYAEKFARLAEKEAQNTTDAQWKDELTEIAGICRKVPWQKPDTFHEALQSIWFLHTALHSGMNLISLGRLDQVLQPFLDENALDKATELFECFLIKAAGRLNLNTEYLVEQDHMDYNAALGVNPYYLDQRAGANNFLQNIIVGGKTPQGKDATNNCTHVIIQAFANVNLSTPGIYVRMHSESPTELAEHVAESLHITKNLPSILNDDVLIPALRNALDQVENSSNRVRELDELANDYCVDGCWEPILNGKSEWTFCMINGMVILQCALNRGATLDPDPGMLRGGKLSCFTGEIQRYSDLKKALETQVQFFVDQAALAMYKYYMINEYVVPSPLFSAFLDDCLENGRDKSWSGAAYNIAGTILIGVPDMVNTICAIRKWVFEEEKYEIGDILGAMRNNYASPNKFDKETQNLYTSIQVDFATNSPKFGNNDPDSNEATRMVLDYMYEAVQSAKQLGNYVFEDLHKDEKEKQRVKHLRDIAGYYGPPLEKKFGENFDLIFTAGMGTFEQYPLQGSSIPASADRRSGDPLAPNFTPMPGTAKKGIANILASFNEIGLDRFAAGTITDLCLDESEDDPATIKAVVRQFMENNGSMMTLTIGNRETYQEIYEKSVAAGKIENRDEAFTELRRYENVNVRVGGWQAPFISMALNQQENYIYRPVRDKN